MRFLLKSSESVTGQYRNGRMGYFTVKETYITLRLHILSLQAIYRTNEAVSSRKTGREKTGSSTASAERSKA